MRTLKGVIMSMIVSQTNDDAILMAAAYTDSTQLAALSIVRLSSHKLDVKTVYEGINKQIQKVNNGDFTGIESTLTAQAMTLDLLYNKMMRLAVESDQPEKQQFYMDVAMRAQNQCRKTMLALGSSKIPPQQTVVKQQNIAVNQQVNNGSLPKPLKIKPENELLEAKQNEWMDTRAQTAPSNVNSQLETVEERGGEVG
jgi:hypothetical protein